jgi:2-succinyl-5-enolpyruvyl-6-hydroxy-3-cyclohexene-1-carboxylate synthase
MCLDFRNLNTLWASVLVETLFRLGLTSAVISPGSRSTPLTLAFASHPRIEALPILDERSAAFFALGKAKQLGLPVVLVCTSGTAGANFYPAVIEAKESRVPLLILTADRPRELRYCHAGQTIEQTYLYSHYPQWQTELSQPVLGLLPYLRQTLLHAWECCLFPHPGVVHLNVPFDEPLVPFPDGTENLAADFPQEDFFAHLIPPVFPRSVSRLPEISTSKGIIIAGVAACQSGYNYSQAIANLAQSLHFPVLTEALSPVRNYAVLNPYLVCTYDFILRHSHPELIPEIVIQLGKLPTSKELRVWLSKLECPRVIIEASQENFDPLHSQTTYLRISPEDLLSSLPTQSPPKNSDYLLTWLNLEARIQAKILTTLTNTSDLVEGKIPWLLSQHLPPHTPIFIANSMPVRDAEFFWLPNNLNLVPYFNRGANGIDGTLSTALGIAHRNQASILLTGDLALLHDTNGFLLREKFSGSLTIILINNNGAGIFETLPIAQFEPPFEEFFATPQNLDFAQLCQTYKVGYFRVSTWQELIERINPLPATGIQVIEIPIERKENARWLKEIPAILCCL